MDDTDKLVAVMLFIGLVSAAAGYVVGLANGEYGARIEAIEAGVAEFTVEPKTGETSFEWIKPVVGK